MDELPLAQPARIVGIRARGGALLRLMEMGLVRGARLELRKRAPWGGPLELKVEGYLLTLRRTDAAAFQVEPDTPPVTAPVVA